MQKNIDTKAFIFYIMAFEVVAGNSACCNGNTYHG